MHRKKYPKITFDCLQYSGELLVCDEKLCSGGWFLCRHGDVKHCSLNEMKTIYSLWVNVVYKIIITFHSLSQESRQSY
jgi:hypothetical protein